MNKIDIKGGQMTFGQRIELGEILTDKNLSEYQKFRRTMLCLDPEWKTSDLPKSTAYFEEVLEGIRYWIEREAQDLKYNPTPEEQSAGIDVLGKLTGEMGTIMAIAKEFSTDPDVVLGWKYGKVFRILYVNLQSYLYRVRLDKQYEKKAKAESRKGRMGKR